MDLEYGAYPSFRELAVYCHHCGGALMQLLVTVCGYADDATMDFAHDLGMALTLDERLHRLRAHALAGRNYLPEDEMQAAGVQREELLRTGHNERLQTLLRRQGERVLDFLHQAEQRLPARDAGAQRSQLVLAALAAALQQEMKRDGYPVLEQAYELTPIRKLWIAWRTARRAGKR